MLKYRQVLLYKTYMDSMEYTDSVLYKKNRDIGWRMTKECWIYIRMKKNKNYRTILKI